MAGSTISTTISKEVFLGSGVYLNPLSITSTGRIAAPAPDTGFQNAAAIYANLIGGSIINRGVISGAIPAADSYTAPAVFSTNPLNLNNYGSITGQSGIYLQDGGTITNSGSISGTDARTAGGYGVRLAGAELVNSASVYGARYGVAEIAASEVINSGTISGAAAGIRLAAVSLTAGGTLANTGVILGGADGVTAAGALITNSDTIAGQTFGLRSAWGGTISNSGQISGAVDGVLLLNQQYQAEYATRFSNSGTIQGGYFGLALNFDTAVNASAGLIQGSTFGAGVGASGSFYNAGTVAANYGGLVDESGGHAVNAGTVSALRIGLDMFQASNLTNAASGYVTSANTAALNMGGYLVNAGSMVGSIYGIELLSGGIAVNMGRVTSTRQGVYLSTLSAAASPDFLLNEGYIYGGQLGIDLKTGTAYNYGIIGAAQIGATLVTGASFNNHGDIYGVRYGVQLRGGTLVNSGSIGGSADGIRVTGGYLTNAGTIAGGKYAIYGSSFSLTIDPGASFAGTVLDKSKTSTLNLAGATPATLTGLGAQFSGFTTINFKPGADWLVSGTTAALAGGQVINGFEQGDTIVLTGFSAASDSFVSGTGLKLTAGSTTRTLDITGSFTTANFSVTSSGTTTTIKLQSNAPCFVKGTRILTPRGEIAVEDLLVGEHVVTQPGEDRPIIWIGFRMIDLKQHPRAAEVQPVCIAAGALEEDVPRRDLWVSPDHALWIDDRLVPAQLLLNGLNVYRGNWEAVCYYHVELDTHAVLFAERAPAESYLETGNRHAFENGGAEMTLNPDFSAMLRHTQSCAALLLEGAKLEEIRGRVLRRHPSSRRLRG